MFTLAIALFALTHGAPISDPLLAGWQDPPRDAKPQTWWHWMNGNASAAGITADLEAMKKIGLGGAQIFNVDVGFPSGPAAFMGSKWRGLIQHAANEAHRLNLELAMHNTAGWSSTGGPWVTPAHGMQVLAWSTVQVHGPAQFDQVLPPAKAPQVDTPVDFYEDIAVYAYPTPPSSDLKLRFSNDHWLGRSGVVREDGVPPIHTDNPATDVPVGAIKVLGKPDADGRFHWDVPAGDWTILRLGHTPTGVTNHPAVEEGRGLEIDKLSREAMDAYWTDMLDKVIGDSKPVIGKGFNIILIDSYEVGTQNWSPKFREAFQELRGYDPLPYLPTVTGQIVTSADVTDRFLWDVRRTIAELYTKNYYGYFKEKANAHGLRFETEAYGNGGFDNLSSGGVADIPMAEFWPPNGGAEETTKLASSSGHTYGRPIIAAESFTSDLSVSKYTQDPYSLKVLGDRMYCNGINRFVFHRYAHQPWLGVYPGMTMGPWGLNFERTITWWNDATAWIHYLTRCQYLLQSGKFVADAIYFVGEDEPKDLPYRPNLRPEIPPGYDYDGCDTDVLLNDMTVKNHQIVLRSGQTYRILVLPQTTRMTPRVLRKIRVLVQEGATVVGPKPTGSPSLGDYPNCDAEVQSNANAVWGNIDGEKIRVHRFGAGVVVDGVPLTQVFRGLGVAPDFEVTQGAGNAGVDDIHRKIGSADAYFVSNQNYRPVVLEVAFRVQGLTPELWHPDTGVTEPAAVWHESKGRTYVRLAFDPAGSVFVLFRRPAKGAHLTDLQKGGPKAVLPKPQITILSATYGPDDNSSPGTDVTAIVAKYVAQGHEAVSASNSLFGDPAFDHVKHLKVDYKLNGKALSATVAENDTLAFLPNAQEWAAPDYDVTPDGRLVSWAGGTFTATRSNGHSATLHAPAAKVIPVTAPWNLSFPPDWGAPPTATFPKLISWPDSSDEGIKYFSGTATYRTTFDLSPDVISGEKMVSLDLGKVKNFAKVKLNGRELGILWKAPFRIDVTGIAHAGKNTLEIEVTNLWPNRLIGDEQQPPEVEYDAGGPIKVFPEWLKEGKPKPKSKRYTFVTWHFYNKNSPLLPSGLLGPVVIRSAKPLKL